MAVVRGCPELGDVPDYAAGIAKLRPIMNKRDQARETIERLGGTPGEMAGIDKQAFEVAALAILDGRPMPEPAGLKTELARALFHYNVYEDALVMQVKVVDAVADGAGDELAERFQAMHKKIVGRLRDALTALVTAQRQELAFHGEMVLRGIAAKFPDAAFRVPFSTPLETLEAAEEWLTDHR